MVKSIPWQQAEKVKKAYLKRKADKKKPSSSSSSSGINPQTAARNAKKAAEAAAKSSSSGSNVETIGGKQFKVSVAPAARDAQGKTALDRQIAANKAKSGITTTPQPTLSEQYHQQSLSQPVTTPAATQVAQSSIGQHLPSGDDLTVSDPNKIEFKKTIIPYSEVVGYLGIAGLSGAAAAAAGKATTAAQSLAKVAKVGFSPNPVGLSAEATKIASGVARVTEVATNTKTLAQTNSILSKVFSTKALVLVGGWASAVFLGKWGQAESTEPLSIEINKYLIPYAMETGDWSAVEEAQAARDEILNLEWWEQVGLWSPISPFIGIPKKIKGAIAGATAHDRIISDLKQQQETGESNDDKWERIRTEQADQDQAAIDYYNIERMKMVNFEREAKAAQRNEDAAFWAKEREKQAEFEKKDREAIADFWFEYRKRIQEINDNSRPSNLNFGLL